MPKKSTSSKSTAEKTETLVAPTLVNASEFTKSKKVSHQFLAQLVVDLQHNLHRSTAHAKTRGEVAGSTKKPWRQIQDRWFYCRLLRDFYANFYL